MSPGSELGVCVAVAPPARRAIAGLHEDSFHGPPQAVLARTRHGVHLHLAVDGPAVLLPGHRQQCLSGPVAEAHGLLAPPRRTAAHQRPLVQVVAFAFVAKRAHLLQVSGETSGKDRQAVARWCAMQPQSKKVKSLNADLKPCVCASPPQLVSQSKNIHER